MKRNLFTIMLAFLVVFGMNAQKARITTSSFSVKDKMSLSDKEIKELKLYPQSPSKFVAYTPSNAKGVVLDEGFEAGIPVAWTQYQIGAATNAAGFEDNGTLVSPHTGSGSMYHNDFNADGAVDDWIVMPQISITSDVFELTFWQADYFQTYYEYHGVMISIGSGDPNDGDFVEVYAGDVTADWEETTISLSAYNGQDIYIAFRYQGDYMDEWYIDDVKVAFLDPHDLGVEAITPSSVLSGGTVTPQVTIHNYGSADEAAYDVELTDASGYTSTKNVAVNLASGADAVIDMDAYSPADGDYTLTATVSVAGDANAANDVLAIPFKVLPVGMLLEDFESGVIPPSGWEVTAGGDYHWALGDDNTWFGTLDNFFAVMSADINGVPDTLISPQLTLDGTVTEFSYDVVGENNTAGYGSTSIQIMYSADKVTWTDVGTAHDMSANQDRHNVSVDISAIPNGDYYFAIEAVSTFDYAGYTSWIGIDNIAGPVIAGLSANDLSIVNVVYPHDFVMDGAAATITAKVKNVGTTTQTGTTITLTMDGGSPMTATIGTLAYGESEVVSFSWTGVAGKHTFEASVPADDNTANDTGSDIGVAVGAGWLYEGFESGTFVPANWEGDVDGHWFDWTDPFVGTREGTHVAGTVTSTAGTYTDAMLSTPKITLSGAATDFLHFYAALGNDGVGDNQLDVAYSTDKATWTDIATDLSLTDKMQLFSYDLSGIPAGDYYIGFRAAGAGDGTYSTLIALDHVVGPMLTPPSTETDFLTYSIPGETEAAAIDNVAKTILVKVPFGTDVTALVATFTLSDGASAAVGGTAQVSGTTPNDFTNVVAYDITAEDGTTVVPWGVLVQVQAASTDATLSALTYNGTSVPSFDAATYTYDVELAAGTTVVPTVVGTPTDANANAVTTDAAALPGASTVLVTAEDGTAQLTYTINFTVAISVNDIASKGISVYPNPSNGTFTVNVENDFNLEVLDITGKVINTRILNGNSTISIENAGVYFLRFSNEEGSVTQKVIVQ